MSEPLKAIAASAAYIGMVAAVVVALEGQTISRAVACVVLAVCTMALGLGLGGSAGWAPLIAATILVVVVVAVTDTGPPDGPGDHDLDGLARAAGLFIVIAGLVAAEAIVAFVCLLRHVATTD